MPLYTFSVFSVGWAHCWRAASASQSWSDVLAPWRDDIHCSGYEELFKEHLKNYPCQRPERWICEDIPNTNSSWVETVFVGVYTFGGEGELMFMALLGAGSVWGQKNKSHNGESMVVSHRLLIHVPSCTTWWGGQLGGAPVTTFNGDHPGGLSHWFATNLGITRYTASRQWMWLVWKGSQT